MTSAVVVGSGPNGLAAAIVLARAGLRVELLEARSEIGGGVHSSEGVVPGLVVDDCSAVHPIAAGSPFLNSLDLGRHGLRWCRADIDCVHPLDDDSAGVLYRSLDRTAAAMGADGRVWRALFQRLADDFGSTSDDILRPLVRLPDHPIRMAHFGARALLPAGLLAHALRTEPARALFAGIAAHSFRPLTEPLSAAIGVGIIVAGHANGWAVAEGGSGAITCALAHEFRDAGGRIRTNSPVRSYADLPKADVVMFDLTPAAAAEIMGPRLPARIRHAFNTFRRGAAAYKVDLAVSRGVPWKVPEARRACTVHLGGNFAELSAAERDVNRGVLSGRPFVLVGQQYLADPSRSVGDIHPVWAYAHVPRGFDGDATEAILDQIERFAPGFRQRVVGLRVRSTQDIAAANLNFGEGDILTGSKSPRQLVFGPRVGMDPYSVGVPGVYICSAATPPGPGAHGMCGSHAARVALSRL